MLSLETKLQLDATAGAAVILSEMVDQEARHLGAAFSNMSPWSAYPISAQELTDYLSTQEPGAPRYALRRSDKGNLVVGALGLRESWLRGPYIQFLGIVPEYQNQGIGGVLLAAVEAAAIASSAGNLWVMASAFNHRALSFYQRFGFRTVSNFDGLVRPNQSEVLLRKQLLCQT